MIWRAAAVSTIVAATLVVAAHATPAAASTGTWVGRISLVGEAPESMPPASAWPTTTLVVTAEIASATFHGLTGAAHDAENATTTCSMTFRLAATAGGWSSYRQVGAARVTTAGYVAFSPCFNSRDVTLRVRAVASGAKVRAEFGSSSRASTQSGTFFAQYRGYLRKSR
jgi:hypothetical protein